MPDGIQRPKKGRKFDQVLEGARQVFLSDGFRVAALDRKRIPGSDHFAVLAEFTLFSHQKGTTPRTQGDDQEDAEELVEEGKEDAKKRGVD